MSEPIPSQGKQLLAKAYCHGGDVAFFGVIDLEFEASINNALFGHAGTQKRRRLLAVEKGRSLPDLSFGSIENRVSTSWSGREDTFKHDPRYVATLQRALGLMLMNILERCVSLRDQAAADPADEGVVSARSILSRPDITSGVSLCDVLSVIRTMNESGQLPVQFTEKWEARIIDRLVSLGKSQLGV